jgi:hypothetical protein
MEIDDHPSYFGGSNNKDNQVDTPMIVIDARVSVSFMKKRIFFLILTLFGVDLG